MAIARTLAESETVMVIRILKLSELENAVSDDSYEGWVVEHRSECPPNQTEAEKYKTCVTRLDRV